MPPVAAASAGARTLAVTGGGDPTSIGPGLAGFLAIFAITLASWVLFRSMNKHLRRVRHSPDPAAPQRREARSDPPHGGTGTDDGPGTGPGTGDATGARDGDGTGDGGPGGAGPSFREEPPGGRGR